MLQWDYVSGVFTIGVKLLLTSKGKVERGRRMQDEIYS